MTRPLLTRIATAEIWLGLFLFIGSGLETVLSMFGYGLPLRGVSELLWLTAWIPAAMLITAGAGSLRFPDHMWLFHIPLAMWLIIIGLTLL